MWASRTFRLTPSSISLKKKYKKIQNPIDNGGLIIYIIVRNKEIPHGKNVKEKVHPPSDVRSELGCKYNRRGLQKFVRIHELEEEEIVRHMGDFVKFCEEYETTHPDGD